MQKQAQRRILVVDDLPDYTDSCALMLRLWGYATQVCYDGAAVLETAHSFRPQVVLLDVGMPHMDGILVGKLLRAQPELANLVIIGISGHSGELYRQRAHLAGFDHYLVKPVCPEFLQDLLGRVVPARWKRKMPASLDRQLLALS
jgi:CheY-like chemotaxis protein